MKAPSTDWWGDLSNPCRKSKDRMAKFGLLYLNDGEYQGNQVISAEWVDDSLQTYSENAWGHRVGRNFNDIGYGYQWWSARAGDHHFNHFNLAWGQSR